MGCNWSISDLITYSEFWMNQVQMMQSDANAIRSQVIAKGLLPECVRVLR